MLHDTAAIKTEEVRKRQQGLAVNLKMNHPNIPVKGLVQDGAIQRGNQKRQERDGGCSALRSVRAVVDVVGRHVGQVGVRGVLLDVELVDEVEEDGVLLAGAHGLGGAVGSRGEVGLWVVVFRVSVVFVGGRGG